MRRSCVRCGFARGAMTDAQASRPCPGSNVGAPHDFGDRATSPTDRETCEKHNERYCAPCGFFPPRRPSDAPPPRNVEGRCPARLLDGHWYECSFRAGVPHKEHHWLRTDVEIPRPDYAPAFDLERLAEDLAGAAVRGSWPDPHADHATRLYSGVLMALVAKARWEAADMRSRAAIAEASPGDEDRPETAMNETTKEKSK